MSTLTDTELARWAAGDTRTPLHYAASQAVLLAECAEHALAAYTELRLLAEDVDAGVAPAADLAALEDDCGYSVEGMREVALVAAARLEGARSVLAQLVRLYGGDPHGSDVVLLMANTERAQRSRAER